MKYLIRSLSLKWLSFPLLLTAFSAPAHDSVEIGIETIYSEIPTELSGKRMTVLRAEYPPGSEMPIHRHPGPVFVYVLEGTIRSQLDGDQMVNVYNSGDYWFEPANARHILMDNTGALPAKVIAILFGNDKDELVIPDEAPSASAK